MSSSEIKGSSCPIYYKFYKTGKKRLFDNRVCSHVTKSVLYRNCFCPCGQDMYSFSEHVLCLSLEVSNVVLKIIRFFP